MVAYNFRARFVDPIRAGTKRQTMRNPRVRHARPGETIQLYTGLRTRRCRLIGTATCTCALPVSLDFIAGEVTVGGTAYYDAEAVNWFARTDGFADWGDLRGWFADTHDAVATWSGVLIEWGDFRPLTSNP